MPLVSVLMPCYNVASTVDEALSSLFDQSLTDFEIIAMDDGSSDGTLDRLHDRARQEPRLRVFPLPHLGIIGCLNAGLSNCQSAIIARMDADDRCKPNRLSRQLEMLANHPELAVIGSLVQGFPEKMLGDEFRAYIEWLNELVSDADIKQAIYIQSPLAHPSTAYRRFWVERLRGYQDHGWAEDYDLWLRLYQAGANFGKVPEVLLEWRDHPHRLTHTDGRYSVSSDIDLKAHYLSVGPLSGCDGIFIWAVSPAGNQLVIRLLNNGLRVIAIVDPRSDTRVQVQAIPVISIRTFQDRIQDFTHPAILIAGDYAGAKSFIDNLPADKARIISLMVG